MTKENKIHITFNQKLLQLVKTFYLTINTVLNDILIVTRITEGVFIECHNKEAFNVNERGV